MVDEAKAVDMEMVDVVMVMVNVIEVIMKLTVVIEMMLKKEFDVEVDKEVEVFMAIMCENVSCWKQNTLPPKCPNRKKYTSNIFHDQKGSTKALGYECWTNQELREDFASKDVFYCGGASPPAQIDG